MPSALGRSLLRASPKPWPALQRALVVAAFGLAAGAVAEPTLAERAEVALSGALVADILASRSNRQYDAASIRSAYPGKALETVREALEQSLAEEVPWRSTECGDELAASLKVVSSQGFELESFTQAWRSWAEDYRGYRGPATAEALENLAAGMAASAAGSHFIDFTGAVRVPALLLLAGRASDEELAAAAREAVLPTHENPKVLQAAEVLARAALRLLRSRPLGSRAERRRATAAALVEGAERAGRPLRGVVEEAVAEAQSRDAFLVAASAAAVGGTLADAHTDEAVLGRLTASGSQTGTDVQGGQTSYILPAIIWLVVAYDSFSDAVLANALLGGESGVRAIFVGLLLAARDGAGAIPALWEKKLLPQRPLGSRLPSFLRPLRLCRAPGACHGAEGWDEELRQRGVAVAATIVRLGPPKGSLERYRMFVRIDASELLGFAGGGERTKPADWDDAEDGEWDGKWEPAGSDQVACLARYLQFTSASGRHAPFSLWPAEAMCQLTRSSPSAHESFDVVLSEPITHVIGGTVLGSEANVVKLPRLSVDPAATAPSWSRLCEHVGTIRLQEGRWDIAEDDDAPSGHSIGEL